MKDISDILLSITLGTLVGAWLTLNIARGQDLLANPFIAPTASEKMAEDLLQAWRETRKAMGQSY